MTNTLYIVATPIGNLEDITLRAIRVLGEVDFVIAEDTHKALFLLNHLGIKKPVKSFHSQSTDNKALALVQEINTGKSAALISEAGTPCISDPGFAVLREAINLGVKIVPIPGASALATMLSVSGVPTHDVLFLGFMPVKKGRHTLIESMKKTESTIVIYESVHRIVKTLNELYSHLGDRSVCVGREMTKMFEEFFRGTLSEAAKYFEAHQKGEFVIAIAPENFKF